MKSIKTLRQSKVQELKNKIILDNKVILKIIKESKSDKDLGGKLNKYYKYLEANN